jgi:hypothetical protein
MRADRRASGSPRQVVDDIRYRKIDFPAGPNSGNSPESGLTISLPCGPPIHEQGVIRPQSISPRARRVLRGTSKVPGNLISR